MSSDARHDAPPPPRWRFRRGEHWLLVQVVLLAAFVLAPPWPAGGLENTPALSLASRVLGAVLLVKGLLLLLWSGRRMGPSLTPFPYPREDGVLIRQGPYRLVRHPIYAGVILMAAGWAGWKTSLAHLAGTLALFVFFDLKARREERWLEQRDPEYASYRERVGRWIPRPR